MNRLPRFFSHRKDSSMDSRRNPRKPKLERRNAAKHFTYEAESTTSSSTEPSSSSPSLHTRSLDLSDPTSFRLEGYDGELERICQSLGFSGPEDFAISAAEWNERKGRSSSDLLPRSRLNRMDSPDLEEAKCEISEVFDKFEARVVIEGESELSKADLAKNDLPELNKATQLTRNEAEMSSSAPVVGGIKGIRPPVLQPPPSKRILEFDNGLSTWDILRGFAPSSDDGVSKARPYDSSSSDEEGEEIGELEAVKMEEMEGDERFRDTGLVSRSCSFTTSNEDDSSTTTTEPRSNYVSPVEGSRRVITHWQKGDLLGRGSFGSVYEGFSGDGFFFAIKEVSLLDQGSQGKQSVYQLEQEIALLSQFEHENIVKYHGTDKDDSKLYIFLELVTKGSLASLYHRYSLRDSHVSAYTRQILHGLKYLHDQGVIHRDIKCANILVHSSGSVKLADFGLAKAVRLNDVKSCKGTAFWMAPEVVRSHGYGFPADIWSLGCTVLEMLTGHFPYYPLECMQAMFRIGGGQPPPVPDSISEDAQNFVLQCVKVNPDDRPSAAQLLNHPFVKRPLSTSSGSASPSIVRQL